MIRRKIWVTALCCLAVGGIARGQTDSGAKASLGRPQAAAGYLARGAAPMPGYPVYAAPTTNYTVPAPGTYTPAPAFNPAAFASAQQAPATVGTPVPMDVPSVGSAPTGMMSAPGPVASYLDNSTAGMYPSGQACPTDGSPCGPMPCVWIAPEYIRWRTRGMQVPALVTGAPSGSPGTLDDANTSVLYGNGPIQDSWRSGVRVRAGLWLDKCGNSGLDVGFFYLGQGREKFVAQSTGDPGIFRPFFNAATGKEDSELVAFISPSLGSILTGRVSVTSTTDFLGVDPNYRQNLCCGPNGRIDLLVGYRYLRLRDTLAIREDLMASSADANAAAPLGTQITVFDRFETTNDFHGGQVGIAGEISGGRWILNYRGTLALGATNQRVNIAGSTSSLQPDGTASNSTGGLLAQTTNIGSYTAERFSVVPEVGLSLGYQLSKNLRVTGGYNFLYWSNVARAGDQIDRTVNATFIPNPGGDPATGVIRPAYSQKDTGFWAHGWSVGMEWRW